MSECAGGPGAGGVRRRCCEQGDGTQRGLGRGRGAFLEPAILIALSGGNSHGYDLARAIEEITGGEVVPDTGGLYRILRRLEEDGAVESWWEDTGSGPQRRSYRLTPGGRMLLAHWLGHLIDRRDALDRLIQAAGRAGS